MCSFSGMHEKLRLSNTLYKCFQGELDFLEKDVEELETLEFKDKDIWSSQEKEKLIRELEKEKLSLEWNHRVKINGGWQYY